LGTSKFLVLGKLSVGEREHDTPHRATTDAIQEHWETETENHLEIRAQLIESYTMTHGSTLCHLTVQLLIIDALDAISSPYK
jgi:hypothetical protein